MTADPAVGPVTAAKRPLLVAFAGTALLLLVLPLFTTTGEILTRLAMAVGLDDALGRWIAPYEVWAARGVLALFGIPSAADGSLLFVGDAGRNLSLHVAWNCVGWQTLVFLVVTVAVGAAGRPPRIWAELLVIGVLGVALLNVVRIAAVAMIAYAFGPLPAVLAHDYGSTLATIGALTVYWAFVGRYILVEPEA